VNAISAQRHVQPPAAVPMPIRAVGIQGDRYVFEFPDGRRWGLTFVGLCNLGNLTMLCGADPAWLFRCFPAEWSVIDADGSIRRISVGIHVQAAAHFLADLCIARDTQKRCAPPTWRLFLTRLSRASIWSRRAP
jgi:hypothetical protein